MILLPFLLILAGYQLGWYGYAILQQPVPCPTGSNQDQCGSSGCTGFLDLLLPSHIATVDACIQNDWDKANIQSGSGPGGQFVPGSPYNQNPAPPSSTTPSSA